MVQMVSMFVRKQSIINLDMTFLKQNWFKIGILCVLVLLALSLGSWLNYFSQKEGVGVSQTANEAKQRILGIYLNTKAYLPPHELYCIPERKITCSIDGCTEAEPNVFVLLEEGSGNFNYSRCDNKPCDTYPATPYISGAYMEVRTNDNHGILFKSSTIDQSYVEVVTLGTDTLTSHGHCYNNN